MDFKVLITDSGRQVPEGRVEVPNVPQGRSDTRQGIYPLCSEGKGCQSRRDGGKMA
jgi:hypothetical protein